MNWQQNVWWGFTLVFVASFVGSIPYLWVKSISARTQSFLLGLSAGIMLAATFFSLLLPGLLQFEQISFSPRGAVAMTALLVCLGGFSLFIFHEILPHQDLAKANGEINVSSSSTRAHRQWLVILAIALHNLPEGLAVGVGQASGNLQLSQSLSIAIALQDLPEGFIVALGLNALGLPIRQVLGITALTGLIEAIGVLMGYGAMSLTQNLLPYAFALCAGAMLFVVSHEVIPESHRQGHEKEATFGLLFGFSFMMFLDKL